MNRLMGGEQWTPKNLGRSWLYIPPIHERALNRGAASGAHVCILDLEDALAPREKDQGRKAVSRLVPRIDWNGSLVFVRIDVGGNWRDDVAAAVEGGADGIVVPKAGRTDLLGEVRSVIDSSRPGMKMAVLLEDPSSIVRANEVLGAIPDIAATLWGTEDLSLSLGSRPQYGDITARSDSVVATARDLVQLASSSLGVAMIDAPHMNVEDVEGVRRAAMDAARQGLAGKQAIHPSHVPIINRAFEPTQAEIQWAEAVIEAIGGEIGRAVVRGRLVDAPHLVEAQAILARAVAESGSHRND